MRLTVLKNCLSPKQYRAKERMIEIEREMKYTRNLDKLNNLYSQAKKIWNYNFIMDEVMSNIDYIPDHERIYNIRLGVLGGVA